MKTKAQNINEVFEVLVEKLDPKDPQGLREALERADWSQDFEFSFMSRLYTRMWVCNSPHRVFRGQSSIFVDSSYSMVTGVRDAIVSTNRSLDRLRSYARERVAV